MAATSISNSVDKRQFEPREKLYLETVKKYTKEELDLFPKMYVSLVLTLQKYEVDRCPRDVLGEVFHELNIQSKWHGQFFSPEAFCNLMGELSIGERDSEIEQRGYVTVNEPACGGGAMLFGFMTAFAKRNYNYCKQMLVEASDVDIKCVYMTYIQLSLYGIPAVVLHRNTLTMETWSSWYTPVYILDGWSWRQKLAKVKQAQIKQSNEAPEVIEELERKKICEQVTLF